MKSFELLCYIMDIQSDTKQNDFLCVIDQITINIYFENVIT